MPRPGTIAADIKDYLEKQDDGATLGQISDELKSVRRSPVFRPSVRSAIYQHMGQRGDALFVRLARGRYGLRRD
jgi:hypothetical protein